MGVKWAETAGGPACQAAVRLGWLLIAKAWQAVQRMVGPAGRPQAEAVRMEMQMSNMSLLPEAGQVTVSSPMLTGCQPRETVTLQGQSSFTTRWLAVLLLVPT